MRNVKYERTDAGRKGPATDKHDFASKLMSFDSV